MTSPTSTFPARLADHALHRGEQPAVVAPDRTLTYGELARATQSLARELRARGVERGATVAITARGETDHLLAALALLALGVPQLGLASHDPPAMRERFARRVRATHVLTEHPGDAVDGLPSIGLGEAIAASRDRRVGSPLPDVDAHAPAIYLTGSGTTGEPKIVRFSQHELALQAVRGRDMFGERALRAAHVEHNNGKRNRLYTAWEGRTSVLAEGSAALRDICVRYGVTMAEVPPVRAAGLVVACRRDGAMPGVAMRIGGSIVPWALRREVIEWVTPRLFVAYGATEVGNVSVAGPELHDEREVVGRLTAGAEVRIVRKDGSPVDGEETGEIALRTPGMATGYFDDAEATSRHFRDAWFMPGDMASFTRDGLLRIRGRADDMMILNSINIFPAEIERVLEAHPAVGAAAAFPVTSPSHGQIPAAAVELRAGLRADAAELVAYSRAQLGIRAPRRVEILDALPRNPQGKVMRRELARRFETKEGG